MLKDREREKEEGLTMLHFHLGLFLDILFNFCREVVSHIQMMNADCILHAALEGDRDQVKKSFRLNLDRPEHLRLEL